jgi:hypothetical protein
MKLAGLVVGGSGIALVATGVVFAMSSSSAASELEAAAQRNDPWTSELEAKDRSARRKGTLGAVLIGTGVAAVATGGVLFYLGHRATAGERTIAIVPTIDGTQAGLVAWGSF